MCVLKSREGIFLIYDINNRRESKNETNGGGFIFSSD